MLYPARSTIRVNVNLDVKAGNVTPDLSIPPPRRVASSEIYDLEGAEDRISCLKCFFGTTIGCNLDTYDWCPDDHPPGQEETMAWLWFCHPEWEPHFRGAATPRMRKLMRYYKQHKMAAWWEELIAAMQRDA